MRDYVKRRPCVTCGVAEAQFRPGGPWFHVMRVDEERCEALRKLVAELEGEGVKA